MSVVIDLQSGLVSGETPGVLVTDVVDNVHEANQVLLLLGIDQREQSGSVHSSAAKEILTLVEGAVTGVLKHTEFAVSECLNGLLTVLLPNSEKLVTERLVAVVLANLLPKFRRHSLSQKFHSQVSFLS